MSRRTERVASLMRSILAEAIQTRLNDPRIMPITSITRIEVSPDFEVAQVHVSVLANEAQRKLCVEALQSSAGHLRWLLGRELTLRKTPTLVFHLDESLRRGFETVQIIDRVMEELNSTAGEELGDSAEPEAGEPKTEREPAGSGPAGPQEGP